MASPTDCALEVSALRKTYAQWFGAGTEALRGLTLSVPRGTVFGLVGLNGAGKTTFIKLLLGVSRPTAGAVRVLGESPELPSVRQRIGYLPERLHLPAAWTAREYLASVARMKKLGAGAAGEIDTLLGRVGLAAARDVKTGGFSKGMRQRLGLAAALLGRPELLVLDEPTDGVDPLGRIEVRSLLLEEKARGTTVLLNSHLLSESERVCDRIGILHRGQLVKEGPVEALLGPAGGFELRFSPQVAPEGCGFERMGDGWLFGSDDAAALNAALDAARAKGAVLLSLQPRTRELEQLLAEAVQ